MSPVEPVDPRVRLAIAQWPPDARRGAVTTFCVEHSISRKTFYAIRKRALEDGQAAALEPRSRRPKSSPSTIADQVKKQAVAVRAALGSSERVFGWCAAATAEFGDVNPAFDLEDALVEYERAQEARWEAILQQASGLA